MNRPNKQNNAWHSERPHGGPNYVPHERKIFFNNLLSLDYPDYHNHEVHLATMQRRSKPLASTMEVADIESTLPPNQVGPSNYTSKYLEPSDLNTYDKNIRDTPRMHLYNSDPAFVDINDSGESVTFEDLIKRREKSMLEFKPTNVQAYNNIQAKDINTKIKPKMTKEMREVKEKDHAERIPGLDLIHQRPSGPKGSK